MSGRSQPARDAALSAIRKQQRAAGQKLYRIRQSGIDTSTIDPRVPLHSVQGASTRQLQSYANRLRAFNSRSTQFVPGMKGAPLSAATWRSYKRAEKLYNTKSEAFYDSVRDLTIPTLNQTVGQYLKNLRDGTENQSARRQGDYRSFGQLVRESAKGITSEAALQKLLQGMQGRAAPDYLAREAKLQRRILRQMLERTSNKRLIPVMRGLSDEEIITLTQYTEFMDKLEGSYAMAKSISTDTPRWQSSVYESNEEDIESLLDWAHRHFTEKSEQDTDDTGTSKPARDRYGRFVRKDQQLPEPQFSRDEHGRFAPRQS